MAETCTAPKHFIHSIITYILDKIFIVMLKNQFTIHDKHQLNFNITRNIIALTKQKKLTVANDWFMGRYVVIRKVLHLIFSTRWKTKNRHVKDVGEHTEFHSVKLPTKTVTLSITVLSFNTLKNRFQKLDPFPSSDERVGSITNS
jgi:hypothetical protein